MAVTATATLARPLAKDAARPPGHAGWNNPVGDPHYNADVDWYRRVRLALLGDAGEYINIVNWELFDGTVPMKATTDITAGAAYTGTTASPFGPLVNNTTTWTVWATNNLATANTAKYYNTGRAPVSTLRANGQRTIVVLGNQKKVGDAATVWSVYAFLPGAFKVPTASTTISIENKSFDIATGVTIISADWSAAPGSVANLAATVAPGTASQTVFWSSQNDAVAVVTDARTGAAKITGVGTTTITATSVTNPTISDTMAVTGTALVRSAEDEPEAEAVESEEEPPKEEKPPKKAEPKGKK